MGAKWGQTTGVRVQNKILGPDNRYLSTDERVALANAAAAEKEKQICIGAKVRLITSASASGAVNQKIRRTGEIVEIHRAHRWFRARFEHYYECFKY